MVVWKFDLQLQWEVWDYVWEMLHRVWFGEKAGARNLVFFGIKWLQPAMKAICYVRRVWAQLLASVLWLQRLVAGPGCHRHNSSRWRQSQAAQEGSWSFLCQEASEPRICGTSAKDQREERKNKDAKAKAKSKKRWWRRMSKHNLTASSPWWQASKANHIATMSWSPSPESLWVTTVLAWGVITLPCTWWIFCHGWTQCSGARLMPRKPKSTRIFVNCSASRRICQSRARTWPSGTARKRRTWICTWRVSLAPHWVIERLCWFSAARSCFIACSTVCGIAPPSASCKT